MLFNLGSKLLFIIFFRSTLKCIPSNLNCVSPQDSFHFVLIDLELYFMHTIHINFVLSKLTFKPEICEKFSSNCNVFLIDFSEPSKKRVVSSANCDIMYSPYLTFIPVIFFFIFYFDVKNFCTKNKNVC